MESAGIEPAREIWPEVVQVMHQAGINVSGRQPKKLAREIQLHADWAITMGCGGTCPFVPLAVRQTHACLQQDHRDALADR